MTRRRGLARVLCAAVIFAALSAGAAGASPSAQTSIVGGQRDTYRDTKWISFVNFP
jgi:hypothetical protein